METTRDYRCGKCGFVERESITATVNATGGVEFLPPESKKTCPRGCTTSWFFGLPVIMYSILPYNEYKKAYEVLKDEIAARSREREAQFKKDNTEWLRTYQPEVAAQIDSGRHYEHVVNYRCSKCFYETTFYGNALFKQLCPRHGDGYELEIVDIDFKAGDHRVYDIEASDAESGEE